MALFYLGTHRPQWLERTDVPLFVSRRTLAKTGRRKPLPRALGRWALDSGGFSELSLYGDWKTEPAYYVAEVRRYMAEIGNMDWAAIQDWMCETKILAKTGLTIREHQHFTVHNYGVLLALAPEIPWAPVLQGWTFEEYMAHYALYCAAGFDLFEAPVVGVGTMCRRQATTAGVEILDKLARELAPLRLHAFGFKSTGLAALATLQTEIHSADSLAWSYQARRRAPLPGCVGHKNCANCMRYALRWRDELLSKIERATHVRVGA